MNSKEMDKLIAHFDTYFEQNDCMVLHPAVTEGPHIDVLLYEPNEKYPYWKLVTMGASDIKMKENFSLGNRNEYVMFVDQSEDMKDQSVVQWYYKSLLTVALYPYYEQIGISYGHSIEWEPEEGEEMMAAFLEFPQVIENPSVLRCKVGMLKTVVCLQIILLNREERDYLLKIGSPEFSNYLYPENGERGHFLCERKRSDKF